MAKGLKSQMERVEHVMLECQVKAMYEGSATQEDVIAWFQSKVRACTQPQRQTFAQADHERYRNRFAHLRAFAEAFSGARSDLGSTPSQTWAASQT